MGGLHSLLCIIMPLIICPPSPILVPVSFELSFSQFSQNCTVLPSLTTSRPNQWYMFSPPQFTLDSPCICFGAHLKKKKKNHSPSLVSMTTQSLDLSPNSPVIHGLTWISYGPPTIPQGSSLRHQADLHLHRSSTHPIEKIPHPYSSSTCVSKI